MWLQLVLSQFLVALLPLELRIKHLFGRTILRIPLTGSLPDDRFIRIAYEWGQAMSNGKEGQAMSILDEALGGEESEENKIHFYVLQSQTFCYMQQWNMAYKSCRRALLIDDESIAAWMELGQVMYSGGRNKTALKCFEKALFWSKKREIEADIGAYPSSTITAYAYLVRINRLLGYKDKALELLDEANMISPNDPRLKFEFKD